MSVLYRLIALPLLDRRDLAPLSSERAGHARVGRFVGLREPAPACGGRGIVAGATTPHELP